MCLLLRKNALDTIQSSPGNAGIVPLVHSSHTLVKGFWQGANNTANKRMYNQAGGKR
jgi:hypothetical protein